MLRRGLDLTLDILFVVCEEHPGKLFWNLLLCIEFTETSVDGELSVLFEGIQSSRCEFVYNEWTRMDKCKVIFLLQKPCAVECNVQQVWWRQPLMAPIVGVPHKP